MSNLPSDTPRLPKWPFLVGDAALLGLAGLIASYGPRPYPPAVVLVLTGCVVLAALLGVIPFLTDYAGKQDEALDERQRSLEALTRTVSESAEQISIAANSLHELNTLAQKQLQQAEDLPDQLGEQVDALSRKLEQSAATENQALRDELAAMQAAENEKLQVAADSLHQATAELAKREAAVTKQLAAVQELLAQLPDALARARKDAVEALASAQAEATQKLRETIEAIPPRPVVIASPEPPAGQSHPVEPLRETATPEPIPEPAAPEPAEAPPAAEPPPEKIEPAKTVMAAEPEAPEPPPPAESPVTIEPDDQPAAKPAPEPEEAKPARKPRVHHKPKEASPVDEPEESDTLPGLEDTDDLSIGNDAPSAISADGATRLLVTAYIGIGNRLFLRGTGPGLSPDKGVPLQFVSIGKWRWETSEATEPVTVRLYKNDKVECADLGEITIQPEHQREISARF